MKLYNKTLVELQFKLELSKVGAYASCRAAECGGTKEYAKQAVSKHRAISKDIRENVDYLIRQLDYYDTEVEREYSKVVAMRLKYRRN